MALERRVKIVATLGPAVAGKDKLVDLISAGADMVRINAAHGSEETRVRLIEDVRAASDAFGNPSQSSSISAASRSAPDHSPRQWPSSIRSRQ